MSDSLASAASKVEASKSNSKDSIYREMTIQSIFDSFPSKAQRLAQEMTNTGLHCASCGAATHETLEQGVLGHGMSEEQLVALMGRLNGILHEESDPTTITMTERAAKKYLQVLAGEGKEGWGVRFEEKEGGCRGTQYLLDYSEKARANDEVFEAHGIEIHVPKKMLERLLGSEIDYVDGLMGAGFKITNPNVRASCGCGSSHTY